MCSESIVKGYLQTEKKQVLTHTFGQNL